MIRIVMFLALALTATRASAVEYNCIPWTQEDDKRLQELQPEALLKSAPGFMVLTTLLIVSTSKCGIDHSPELGAIDLCDAGGGGSLIVRSSGASEFQVSDLKPVLLSCVRRATPFR